LDVASKSWLAGCVWSGLPLSPPESLIEEETKGKTNILFEVDCYFGWAEEMMSLSLSFWAEEAPQSRDSFSQGGETGKQMGKSMKWVVNNGEEMVLNKKSVGDLINSVTVNQKKPRICFGTHGNE